MRIMLLRPLLCDEYDAAEFYKLIRVNRIGKDHHLSHLKWADDATFESTWNFLRDMDTSDRDDFFFIFAEGKIAGAITLREMTLPTSYEQMIGYWVGKEFCGNGVASEAIRQILARAKYGRVVAHIRESNLASNRALTNNLFMDQGPLAEEGWRKLVWRK